MKITGIEIGEYRQFKNLKFDFTYPEGHLKAGEPLDKVCFIGQSGTGKTTLLNNIWNFIESVENAILISSGSKAKKFNDNFLPDSIFDSKFYAKTDEGNILINRNNDIAWSDKDYFMKWINDIGPSIKYNLIDTQKLCIYIKDSVSKEADAFLFDQKRNKETFSDFIKTSDQIEKDDWEKNIKIDKVGKQHLISLGDLDSLSIWQYLLRDADNYNEENWRLLMGLRSRGISPYQMVAELSKWQEHNKDPREYLAHNCINPLLKNLYLELDLSVANVPIALKTNRGIQIESSLLSTGTRQLLSTAIPLFKFDTQGTVILFDEPERSLFPDIQRNLIKYYISLAPKAQFFFATHSPIIAASFEPEERFILYFNDNGEVKVRRGIAPAGDDPNDILRKDFGMSPLMQDEGLKAYQRYLDLATEIRNEPDVKKKMELLGERAELGERYNFPAFNETN